MTLFIIAFGALTFLSGLVILVNPELVFGFLRKNAHRIQLHILAVAIRLVLGAFLIIQSANSRYPVVIEIIGWLSIVAAVFFAAIGRKHFIHIMAWALSQVKTLGRIGGVIASAFGTFLIYAFI